MRGSIELEWVGTDRVPLKEMALDLLKETELELLVLMVHSLSPGDFWIKMQIYDHKVTVISR